MKISKFFKKQRLISCIFACLSIIYPTANAMFEECNQPAEEDPLIIDLGGDGISLGAKGIGVMFDLIGNGQKRSMQWTAANGNEAFLALDKNGNGIIDDGSELFTNYNLLLMENIPAPNGFADLAQYDQPTLGGNDDGYISAADQIWPQLRLWLDANADAISTADEMFTPDHFKLTRFNTVPRINNHRDNAGNHIPLWSWTKAVSGKVTTQYRMVDVFFKPVPVR